MAKARHLLEQASALLNDPRAQYWSVPELLGYLNAGRRAMVSFVPEQFSVTQTLTLVEGSKQELPAGSVVLLRVHKNINADDTPGRVVRPVTGTALDAVSPGWQQATPATVREVVYDPKHPKEFWVNPPAEAGAKLQVSTADEPDDVQVFTDMPEDARYHGALVDYILFRALSKDADYAMQDTRAAGHYTAFKEGVSGSAGDK